MPPSFTRGIFTIPLEIDGHNPWREARGMQLDRLEAYPTHVQRNSFKATAKLTIDHVDRIANRIN